jgi:hypothetical protein
MIWLRCFWYYAVMNVIRWAVLNRLDLSRHRANGEIGPPLHPFLQWVYGLMDGIDGRAWEALADARPELEVVLSHHFPVVMEGDDERCGLCR